MAPTEAGPFATIPDVPVNAAAATYQSGPAYERPVINSPVEPEDVSTLKPEQRPDPAVSVLRAERVMTFHFSDYKVTAKVKNEGPRAMTQPFCVQILVKGPRDDTYEVMESYLVQSLGAGEEVELQKVATGRSHRSLIEMSVDFRAQILVDPAQQGSPDNDVRDTTVRF